MHHVVFGTMCPSTWAWAGGWVGLSDKARAAHAWWRIWAYPQDPGKGPGARAATLEHTAQGQLLGVASLEHTAQGQLLVKASLEHTAEGQLLSMASLEHTAQGQLLRVVSLEPYCRGARSEESVPQKYGRWELTSESCHLTLHVPLSHTHHVHMYVCIYHK